MLSSAEGGKVIARQRVSVITLKIKIIFTEEDRGTAGWCFCADGNVGDNKRQAQREEIPEQGHIRSPH